MTVEGQPLGLIDLTILGGADKAIVFTDERTYFFTTNGYQIMRTEDLGDVGIYRLDESRFMIQEKGLTEGIVDLITLRITPDQFTKFSNAFREHGK